MPQRQHTHETVGAHTPFPQRLHTLLEQFEFEFEFQLKLQFEFQLQLQLKLKLQFKLQLKLQSLEQQWRIAEFRKQQLTALWRQPRRSRKLATRRRLLPPTLRRGCGHRGGRRPGRR